jgi:hypothetical protein
MPISLQGIQSYYVYRGWDNKVTKKEPKFIVKWIAGILASVITAYLIANFVTSDKSNKGPDIEPGRGVLPYEQKNGLFKFNYPVFLDKVIENIGSNEPYVTVSTMNRNLFQFQQNIGNKSWGDLGFFEKLTMSNTPDFDEMGVVTILLVPTNYLLTKITTKKTDIHSEIVVPDVFAGLDPIARKQIDWNNLPSSGCSQKRTEEAVNLSYLQVGYGASLIVEGRFSKDAWSMHLSEIRRMFGSFSVNEAAAVDWFRSRLGDGSLSPEKREILSSFLTTLSNRPLPSNYQLEKPPDCVEIQ